jgi:hypothetical protein
MGTCANEVAVKATSNKPVRVSFVRASIRAISLAFALDHVGPRRALDPKVGAHIHTTRA